MAVINTNVKSLVAREALSQNNRALSTAMERGSIQLPMTQRV